MAQVSAEKIQMTCFINMNERLNCVWWPCEIGTVLLIYLNSADVTFIFVFSL